MSREDVRLASVVTEPGLTVTVTYTDGNKLRVDLSDLVGRLEVFAPLEVPGEFATAQVTDFGWTLEWSCGASLDSDRLQEMALEQVGMEDNVRFRRWQDRHGLSLAAAASAIGITRRTASQYRTGARPVPRRVVLACKGWEAERNAE